MLKNFTRDRRRSQPQQIDRVTRDRRRSQSQQFARVVRDCRRTQSQKMMTKACNRQKKKITVRDRDVSIQIADARPRGAAEEELSSRTECRLSYQVEFQNKIICILIVF